MSDLVDPALFLEWVLWTKPQLTKGEKDVIYQLRRGDRYERLGMGFIDRVMTRNGATDQLSIFYPQSEMRCKKGHLWSENTVIDSEGRRRCRSCLKEAEWRRRFKPYQMSLF